MKCSCKRTAVRLEKDYRQRSARHKLKKHNKMADEVNWELILALFYLIQNQWTTQVQQFFDYPL